MIFKITNNLNERKYNSLLFAIFLLVIFSLSVFVRHQQLEIWEKKPNMFFVESSPMMSTLDAPYWIRWAREYNNGTFGKQDELRNYPEGKKKIGKKFDDQIISSQKNTTPSSINKLETRYNEVPLLSFLISKLVKFFNYNYYLTGTLIIPTFASLFMIPLGIYFFKIGIPLSGLLGGLVGTFASGYFVRSSIGRIDTDMLNLFFPTLAALLILMASKSKSERAVLLFSIGAGLNLFLFQWWYGKAGFTLIFFIVLVFSLFIHKIRIKIIFLSAFLFILCAHPKTFMEGSKSIQAFVGNYFIIEENISSPTNISSSSPATFPNVFKTISEADTVKMNEILLRIISNNFIAWIGLVSFLVLSVFRWKDFLPFSPIIFLGIFSFQSSNRFIMFLAPLIGIGLGWIITFGIEYFFYLFEKFSNSRQKKLLSIKENKKINSQVNKEHLNKKKNIDLFGFVSQILLYLGMSAFFWTISSKTAISFVPFPSIHTGVYKTFYDVKKIVPRDSAILTWWDYGFAITEATNLATFHDGSSQFSPKTYFIARSFISKNQQELFDITQFLATEGNNGISKNNTSPKDLLRAVTNPINKPWDPIYVFFTADMTRKFGAISRLGSWDIENGGSNSTAYHYLNCNKINNEEMKCQGANIDLIKGKINNNNLRRIIFIKDGKVLREKEFANSDGFTLLMVVLGNRIIEVQLIKEAVFASNYNQMFLLGRYRKDLFDEIYNAPPFSRLYKIKF